MENLSTSNTNISLESIFERIPMMEKLNEHQTKKLIENTTLILIEKEEFLMHENDPSDSFYIVYSGRLVAFKTLENGNKKTIGNLFHGDIIGEISLLAKSTRFASIKAVRQSILLKIENAFFKKIMQENAVLSMKVCEKVIQRLTKSFEQNVRYDKHFINVAVISHGQRESDNDFYNDLFSSVSKYKTVLQVTQSYLENNNAFLKKNEAGLGFLSNLTILLALEREYEMLFFNCNDDNFLWNSFVVQHTDLLIFVFNENDPCPSSQLTDFILKNDTLFKETTKYLVLQHKDKKNHYPDIERWKNFGKFDLIHQVVNHDKNSIHRVARFVTNNNIGLVLSGGGGNGYAHVGVMKAIEELGVNIDVVGGVSVGAFVAAAFAMGANFDHPFFKTKISFPFSFLQPPLSSLLNPKKSRKTVEKLFEKFFGDIDFEIESLWLRYFSLASNIINMEDKVFSQGSLINSILASNALPGLYSPVLIKKQLYIDGGATNTMPIDAMKKIYGGLAIGVSITKERGVSIDSHFHSFPSSREIITNRINPFSPKYKVPFITEILNRATVVANKLKLNEMKKLADLYIEPKFPQKRGTPNELFEAGYTAAYEKIKAWKH